MVAVKVMRWSPWAAAAGSVRKLEARITVQKLEGVKTEEQRGFWIEIRSKAENKKIRFRNFKRNLTVELNQEFMAVCNISGSSPCQILFTVFAGPNQETKTSRLVGTAMLNLAEFASIAIEKKLQMNLPLLIPNNTTGDTPMLCLCLELTELGTIQESVQATIHPIPSSPSSNEALSPARSSLKTGLQKVRLFRKPAKVFREKNFQIEDAESSSPFDTDSLDDESGSSAEDNSGDYETLANANFAQGSLGESWIYYNHSSCEVGNSTATVAEQPLKESTKQRILAWRRRKLSFRTKLKGEPLLKKDYMETGGDDIDFDRRKLSSSDESISGWSKMEEGSTTCRSSFSEFGDDNFAVGSWEKKEVISRDGQMKLEAHVFFASIDQRAAGESACTALVTVIAEWLQSNQYEIPIKSEFDGLIRDGSLEWRKLCENEDYRQQFPDKHFDLDTVLEAQIRPLSVVPEKSFVGFFHLGDFEFLDGAMSFDSIWEEISRNRVDLSENGEPLVYIVSWNDHFFVLRVETDAYYIIDTLGERLFEGCNRAYILKFDKETSISWLQKEPEQKTKTEQGRVKSEGEEEQVVWKGKESCKEYIKSFLAAIPIRQMQADIKKGLVEASATPIHQRLQIEFHYTQLKHSRY